jgi:oxygen-dependent protoporphyrinogen oxidase
MGDEELVALARTELEKLLGPLPVEAFSVLRRWPRSLPQYGVGHLERMAELDGMVRKLPGLWVVGNAYRGVGLPDIVRDARAAAREIVAGLDGSASSPLTHSSR